MMDAEALEDFGKASMASARYRPGQQYGKCCGKCEYFLPDADPEHGDCQQVAGEILGRMQCDWFEPRSGGLVRPVVIVRHGATALNEQDGGVDRIRGWVDVPLSSKGREQAAQLATMLGSSGIDVLFHSTLSRAADTARAIAATTQARLVPMDALKPWDLGEFTGQESKDVHPILCEYVIKRPDEPVPGGESFNAFKARLFAGVGDALRQPAKLPAFVTHHRVERVFAAWDRLGQPASFAIDNSEMLQHGAGTAVARRMLIKAGRFAKGMSDAA